MPFYSRATHLPRRFLPTKTVDVAGLHDGSTIFMSIFSFTTFIGLAFRLILVIRESPPFTRLVCSAKHVHANCVREAIFQNPENFVGSASSGPDSSVQTSSPDGAQSVIRLC